jgi:hypothetical protein
MHFQRRATAIACRLAATGGEGWGSGFTLIPTRTGPLGRGGRGKLGGTHRPTSPHHPAPPPGPKAAVGRKRDCLGPPPK